MAEVSAEARIGAPAEKVWARLTDRPGHGEWNTTHTGFPDGGPDPLEVGASFRENMRLLNCPAETVWTVEEVEPARVPAVRGTGPMPVGVTTRYTLVPDGSGTTVRIDGTFTGAAVSLSAARLTESATAALRQSLRSLDALLT
ncbi:SRPBCC family protein [Streptomyces sp. NPDC059515]|uniref:type II toxin-antitoxin system Rv0910 family toxin n=1 Tax=Streptomyces sp. NPDC059515 TaxID=3346854 RepID=UPI003677A771